MALSDFLQNQNRGGSGSSLGSWLSGNPKPTVVEQPPKRKTMFDSLKEYGAFAGNTVANTYKQIGGGVANTVVHPVRSFYNYTNFVKDKVVEPLAVPIVQSAVQAGKYVADVPQIFGAIGMQNEFTKQNEARTKQAQGLYDQAQKLPQGDPQRTRLLKHSSQLFGQPVQDATDFVQAGKKSWEQLGGQALNAFLIGSSFVTAGGAPLVNKLSLPTKVTETGLLKNIPTAAKPYVLHALNRAIQGGTTTGLFGFAGSLAAGENMKKAISAGLRSIPLGVAFGLATVPFEKVVTTSGAKQVPVRNDVLSDTSGGPKAGDVAWQPTRNPDVFIKHTLRDDGLVDVNAVRVDQPLADVLRQKVVDKFNGVKPTPAPEATPAPALGANVPPVQDLVNTAKEQSAMQAEHAGRPDVAQVIRATDTSKAGSIGEAETAVMRAVNPKVDPKFMKEVVTPYFRSEQQVQNFQATEAPAPVVQNLGTPQPPTPEPTPIPPMAPIPARPVAPITSVTTPAPATVPNTPAPLPQPESPLLTEARKYKSAEEFVNSQQHYWPKTKAIVDEYLSKNPKSRAAIEFAREAKSGDLDRAYARALSPDEGNVFSKLPKNLQDQWATKKALDQETGDIITLANDNTLRGTHIFNAVSDFENSIPSLKTKSKLTSIWNQAQEAKKPVATTPSKPAEIPTHTKYFIQNPKQVNPDGSTVFTEVAANKVEILPNVDTFVTRNPNGQGFIVAEGQTGLAIAEGKTKEQAASNAVQTLLSKTDQVQKAIKDQIALRGTSPRYTMASSLAAPETKTTVIRYKNEKITLPPGITADEMRNIVDFAGSDLNLRQKMIDAANLKPVRVQNVQSAAPKKPDMIRKGAVQTTKSPSTVKAEARGKEAIKKVFDDMVASKKITPADRATLDTIIEPMNKGVIDLLNLKVTPGSSEYGTDVAGYHMKIKNSMESLIELFPDVITPGDELTLGHAIAHEFSHFIERLIPADVKRSLYNSYEKELIEYQKKLTPTQLVAFKAARRTVRLSGELPQSIIDKMPTGAYEFMNFREWFAENFSHKSEADLLYKTEYKSWWSTLRDIVKQLWQALKDFVSKKYHNTTVDQVFKDYASGKYNTIEDSTMVSPDFMRTIRKVEPTELKSIKVPMPKGLFADDAALERDVYENGYDAAKHQVVMKNGEVVLGGEVLRGLQRRSAKGLDVPEKIDVVQMTPEINPPPTAAEITKNLDLPPEQSKGLTVMEQKSNEYAARAELNPKEAAELTAQLIMGKKNWATILADEKIARHVTQPHIRFKGELWDVMHEGYYYQQIAEVTWKKRLEKVFEKMKVREGSKKEKMLEEWRNYYDPKNNKRPTDAQIEKLIKAKRIKYRADQIPEKVRALSDRFTELFTDPIREYAINQGMSMGRRGGYVPRVKLPDAIARFEGSSTDLSFNDWMTKENRDPTIDARSSFKRKMYSYVDMLTKKIYLEPKLQEADELATKIYENDAMKLQEAKKWIQHVRHPYEMEGSVVGQRATQVARITSTMVRQWVASADLGIRSAMKNLAWGGSMLYGKHGNLMWKSMAKLMTSSGWNIVREHAPHLTEEVLPLITGTFGTKVEGSIRVFSDIQRRFMPSGFLQVAGENILRPWSYLTGWMDGEAKGLTGRALELYAHNTVVETQQLYTPLDMQPIFRGQGGAIAGQFVASPLKQQIEILSDIKNKRFMNFGRWLAASIAFFFFLSWMWPKKRLATKDGSKYWSSEIDPWQGIDIWGIHQAWKYRKEVGYAGVAQMVGEQFIAPVMKFFAHVGGYTFKSDEVFSQYSSQQEIIGKDVGYPQRAVVKDIARIAETFGAQVGDDDTRYLSTTLGVAKMLSEAKDEAARAKITKEYSDFVPLVDDAQSTYGELNSIKGSYSAQKSAIKKNPDYSDSTKKQLTDELTSNYLEEKRSIMHRFNQLIANQIKQ